MPRRRDARGRAVEVLREVLERGGRATALLAEKSRGLSPADHDLFRELVLGVLRWKSALDAEIASVSRVPLERLAPKLREILEVALYQIRHLDGIPDYAAVSEAVNEARRSGEGAARLVNGVLRGILLLPPPPGNPLAPSPSPPRGEGRGEGGSFPQRGEGRREGGSPPPASPAALLARHYSHPPFLVERWITRFGLERTLQILEADNRPSPVDLLTNPRRTAVEALSRALAQEGVETRPSPLSPLGLTVVRGNALRSPLFSEGWFTAQDLGSQALPLLLPPGETLVDLAAAPGGKSLAAIWLGRASRSIALDRSIPRLRLLEQNRRRLGMTLSEIRPVAADAQAPPLPAGRFDRVLFDAPCSGTGTLRKSPEIRYRVTPAAIERLSAAQESALAAAASLLAPGGFLLYATCSLEEEENERVVGRVLAKVSGLEPAPIDAPDGVRAFVSGSLFRLFPDARVDGFTAQLLRRR